MPVTRPESPDSAGVPAYPSRWARATIASAWKLADRWKASIGFALFDQGATSVANFVQLAIAARILPIDDFGRYAIVWAFSMLLLSVATALVVDPLPAIISGCHPSRRLPILAAATRLSFLLGSVLAILIVICGLIAQPWSSEFGTLLLWLGIASPLQQMQYASRRFSYLLRRQGVAAASAAAYAIVLVGGVIGLWANALCTAPRLILLSGIAGLAAAAVGVAWGCLPVSKVRAPLLNWLMRRCWRTGKWLIGSSIALWMSSASLLPITAAITGPSASGILRAETTLLMPVYQLMWAIAYLLVPHVADVGARQPVKHLRNTALVTIAAFGAIATAYSIVILALGSDLLTLMYNKPEITAASKLLWPLTTGLLFEAATAAMSIVLIANAVTQSIFWARVASVAVLLPGTLFLGPIFGLDAIVWVSTAAYAVCTLSLVPALVRTLQRPGPPPMQYAQLDRQMDGV